MELPENKLTWKTVTNKTKNPESVWKCEKCRHEIIVHPNYINAGIKPCVGHGRCYRLEEIVVQMLHLKRYKLIKIDKQSKTYKIEFSCSSSPSHKSTLLWEQLRKGAKCKECNNNAKKRTKVKLEKLHRSIDCNCFNQGIGFFSGGVRICPHYNHSICIRGGVDEWNYELNKGISPENISPQSSKKYWYTCKIDTCKMNYEQSPEVRTRGGKRCPYCTGRKTCEWNSLAKNFPEICKEWDPENHITPNMVTSHSNKNVNWICYNHKDEIFKYNMTINDKTNGRGCPKCSVKGYNQKILGHEFFVSESIKVHGLIYEYHEEYKGNETHINIYCNVPHKNMNPLTPHGYFSQTPAHHKNGQGCNKCAKEKTESKGILEIKKLLYELGYRLDETYFREYKFEDLKHIDVLKLDIYIPDSNLIIEYDGQYHFEYRTNRSNEEDLKVNKFRDMLKDKYCVINKINLLRIPYNITPNLNLISNAIYLCKTGNHIYMSYNHYFEIVKLETDLSKVLYIEVPSPKML